MRLVYVTPSCHHPLGATMRMEQRLRLLEIAESRKAWIIEDDFDGEYRFQGQPIPCDARGGSVASCHISRHFRQDPVPGTAYWLHGFAAQSRCWGHTRNQRHGPVRPTASASGARRLHRAGSYGSSSRTDAAYLCPAPAVISNLCGMPSSVAGELWGKVARAFRWLGYYVLAWTMWLFPPGAGHAGSMFRPSPSSIATGYGRADS